MSTNYSATLIAGVPYGEVVTTRTVTTLVTKYNKDTGAPYQKEVHKKIVSFNGVQTADNPLYDYDFFEPRGVKHVYPNSNEKGIVGVEICVVSDYLLWKQEVVGIEEKMAEARTKMPGQAVRLHLVLHAG